MKKSLHSRYGASKGVALIIVLAFVVLATGLGLAYLTRTTTNRQLAQSSYHDTSADLLARSALDIVVGDFKQEITTANAAGTPSPLNIQPQRSGDHVSIPNLIRRSVRDDAIPLPGVSSLASSVSSTSASANGRLISSALWNSPYLLPQANIGSFTAPDWVMVTAQGPATSPTPSDVIGRYAFAVYDEGGLMNMNLGGYPNYASLSRPTRPTLPHRRLPAKYPSEESEIMFAACQGPKFTPQVTNITIPAGQPCSLLFSANQNPTSFSASNLPGGLTINTTNGNITGTPSGPGQWTITLTCSNGCPPDGTGTLHLTITGYPVADSTPWPVNLARKGTVAFADLTALPPSPTFTQINTLMGWRNYATTRQSGASFNSPSFPPGPSPGPSPTVTPTADLYARYFLGAIPPYFTPFTTVSAVAWCSPAPCQLRTDQAMMNRQELIRLQRTIGFSQDLLQYLGTFSREWNRPALSWAVDAVTGNRLTSRWDMNNLQIVIPAPWFYPGNHGQGHAWGKQRFQNGDLKKLFGLTQWVAGSFATGTRFTDPNYYGHWVYDPARNVDQLPASDVDFFQVIDYALKQKNGGVSPNKATVFAIGAALIDQYDTDDLHDSGVDGSETGNTITVIDYLNDGKQENYAYGVEDMSFAPPAANLDRPPFAPGPDSPPLPSRANYACLNRRFENVGEFGYAFNPASTTLSKTLDFAFATNNDTAVLDLFTYNSASNRAGIVNLNTRNAPVLASIIQGAWVQDPGAEILPSPTPAPPTILVSQADALAAANAIVGETTSNPALSRADVARLAAVAANAVPNLAGSDEAKETIARALAEVGQARTWNVMIDVIAQTGKYKSDATNINQADKFIVQGEKRYWLHISLDRDNGTVLGSQLEEVVE